MAIKRCLVCIARTDPICPCGEDIRTGDLLFHSVRLGEETTNDALCYEPDGLYA